MIRELKSSDLGNLSSLLGKMNEGAITESGLLNQPFRHYLVYEVENTIVGLFIYSIMYEHSEIENIYVEELYRKQQVGTSFILYMIEVCSQKNIFNITLEVACNNMGAISLYQKMGFYEVAVRKNYYPSGDAILMERKVVEK